MGLEVDVAAVDSHLREGPLLWGCESAIDAVHVGLIGFRKLLAQHRNELNCGEAMVCVIGLAMIFGLAVLPRLPVYKLLAPFQKIHLGSIRQLPLE